MEAIAIEIILKAVIAPKCTRKNVNEYEYEYEYQYEYEYEYEYGRA